MTATAPRLTDAELLSSEITASGLTARQYAIRVLFRNDQTVYRWLKGKPISSTEVREQLLRWHTGQDPRPYQVIAGSVQRDAAWGSATRNPNLMKGRGRELNRRARNGVAKPGV